MEERKAIIREIVRLVKKAKLADLVFILHYLIG